MPAELSLLHQITIMACWALQELAARDCLLCNVQVEFLSAKTAGHSHT